jgi:hypothetical protein
MAATYILGPFRLDAETDTLFRHGGMHVRRPTLTVPARGSTSEPAGRDGTKERPQGTNKGIAQTRRLSMELTRLGVAARLLLCRYAFNPTSFGGGGAR